MDVIALVRAGFAHAVAPLGTAFTDDQLHMLWRSAPEPVLAFHATRQGRKAALRAAHMALAHLKAGHSLRFVPARRRSGHADCQVGRRGDGRAYRHGDAASELLWRAETEGKDFSTPERLAGLEHRLAEIAAAVYDGDIAAYYRDFFREKVFAQYKRRPAARVRGGPLGAFPPAYRPGFRPAPVLCRAVRRQFPPLYGKIGLSGPEGQVCDRSRKWNWRGYFGRIQVWRYGTANSSPRSALLMHRLTGCALNF